MRKLPTITVILGASLTVAGCGGGLGAVPAGGVVTYNGQPVEGAHVMFVRDGEKGPAAIAVTNAEGRFDLQTGDERGAVPGAYRATVKKDNSAELGIPDPLPEGTTRTDYMRQHNLLPVSLLPPAYGDARQTPLQYVVTPTARENDFQLQLEGQLPAPRAQPTSTAIAP